MKKKPARKRVDSPFGRNLELILKEKGISQRKAASLAGVSVAVISQWTSGAQPGDPLALQRLARALAVDFEWLLTGSVPQASTSKNLALNELFEVIEEEAFSGLFLVSAKRLKRREE